MKLNYKAKRFQFEDGEECSMLKNSNGMIMELPALYVIKKIRQKGDAANTIYNKVSALAVLYTWLDRNDINLALRFMQGEYLNDFELDSLKDFCARNFSLKASTEITTIVARKIILPSKNKKKIKTIRTIKTPSVANTTQYSRMTYIGPYLQWLAIYSANNSPQRIDVNIRNTIKDMVDSFLDDRPTKKTKRYEPISLTEEEREEVIKYFSIESPLNPFVDKGVLVRNKVIFALLMHLGIRVGEMLGIKIEDINFQDGQLTIHRRPHDKDDPRRIKARQKTTARELPMNTGLVLLLQEYIVKHRRKIKKNNKSPYLLISHFSSKSNKGIPLSHSSVNKIFAKVRSVSDVLVNFYPYMLRHTWSDMFCEWIDNLPEENKYSEEEGSKLHRNLAGWSEDSKMAQHYSKRHIRKKAAEGSIQFQNKLTLKVINKSKGEDGKQ